MSESNRIEDVNGFIAIKKNPITRVGVFPYLGRSIGAPEPDRIYMVYRPEEELNNQEAIDSFKTIPIVNDHEMLGDDQVGLTPAERKGLHGTTGDDVVFENGVLYSNIKIFSKMLRGLIEQGKKDLSLGYRCIYEKLAGTFNGQHYDYVQRRLRGNHLALVDQARCDVAVLDHNFAFDQMDLTQETEELKMAENENPNADKDEDKKEPTLAEVAAIVESIVPVIAKINETLASLAVAKPADVVEETLDEDEEKKDDDKKDEKKAEDEDDKKESKAMDSAIKILTAKVDDLSKNGLKNAVVDVAKRNELYSKVSPIIGAFAHDSMTAAEVAAHAVKELKLDVPAGQEVIALDSYLKGVKTNQTGFALDHGNKKIPNVVSNYINSANA